MDEIVLIVRGCWSIFPFETAGQGVSLSHFKGMTVSSLPVCVTSLLITHG